MQITKVCLCIALICAMMPSVAKAQVEQSRTRPTLKAYTVVKPAPAFDMEAAKEAATSGKGLPLFLYSFNATNTGDT
jgi:hypothetical protein